MPIYYLNCNGTKNEFYTDNGSLIDALRIASSDDLVKFTYIMGHQVITGKKHSVYMGKASADMEMFLDWLTPDIAIRLLMQKLIHVEEFTLKINHDVFIQCKSPHDFIVHFTDESTLQNLCKALGIPKQVQAAMLLQPGSLFSAVQRTGQYSFVGYFKSIHLWLNQHRFEKIKHQGFFQSNMN